MKKSRRDFLKLMGAALGGVTLSSCGSSDGPSGGAGFYGALPSGYRYYRVFNIGEHLPNNAVCDSLPGSAMINDRNEIYFHAAETNGEIGCYELVMDYSGERPTITSMRTVIHDGDQLPDGHRVKRIRQSDISRHGTFVTVARLEGTSGQGVYLEKRKGFFSRVVGFLDKIPGKNGIFSQAFGDVDVHDNNDILLAARFTYNETNRPHQGLFFFPGGQNDKQARLVAFDSDLTPDADGIIRSFGLVDLNDGGNYVVQANVQYAGLGTSETKQPASDSFGTALFMGNTAADAPSTLLAPAKAMGVSPAAKASGLLSSAGDVIYGPRIGSFQNPAHIVHLSENDLALYYNGVLVLQTGDLSPNGYPVSTFGAPVIGDEGLLYYTIATSDDVELCAYNGNDNITILSRGDAIEDGSVVNDITFGMQTEHVDMHGKLCFIAEFEDASSAVVVGIPE